ncbi:putative mitochondrial protein [Sesamum angolense]|uniref:Mitochondrial protein n=1 Tax=Sesamum angolense TaxID=2727404 RepID=A0AAE1WQ20_9LAMI|nr:putative mitochondrial protein [Sesamum angolense]
MSCFKMLEGLLADIESMMANFFWHPDRAGKIHWLPWKKLCLSKMEGGLGFRNLSEFNQALYSEWGARPSYAWHSLLHARPMLELGLELGLGLGLCWFIRNGRNVAAPKVLLFAWKCCQGVVPSAINLKKRGVIVDSSCALCRLEEVHVMHVLAECSYARQCWVLVHIPAHITTRDSLDAGDLAEAGLFRKPGR